MTDTVTVTPQDKFKALKDEAEALKLKQSLTAADAKEAEAAVGEIERDVAQWQMQRPLLEELRVRVKGANDTLGNDVSGLKIRDKLDRIKIDYDEITSNLEKRIKDEKQKVEPMRQALDEAKINAERKRMMFELARAEGRKRALDDLERRIKEADSRYDNGRRAEAYMFREVDFPEDEDIKARLANLPESREDQRAALEKAYSGWLEAKAGLKDKTLELAGAERTLTENEGELKRRTENRTKELLAKAADLNAAADQREQAPPAFATPLPTSL